MKKQFIHNKVLNKLKESKILNKIFSSKKSIMLVSFFMVFIIGGLIYMVFAETKLSRPTYCLTCKRDQVHDPKNIWDYQDKFTDEKQKIYANYSISLNGNKIADSNGPTKAAGLSNLQNVAFIGDTLTFKDINDKVIPDQFNFQYELPSGISIIEKNMTRSQFNSYSVKLTEAGRYKFYLAVGKGTGQDNVQNWNGEHIVLGCGNSFPDGVYTFFVEIDVDVQEYTLNVEYYTDDINKPIAKESLSFGKNNDNKTRIDGTLFRGTYIVDSNIPTGYQYDNKWILYTWNMQGIAEGTTDTTVNPGWGAVSDTRYFEKTLRIKVSKISGLTPIDVDVEYRLDSKTGEKLHADKTVVGYVNTQFNLSAEKIDDYICKKYIVIGQSEKEFDGTSASFKMNSDKWCTPVSSTNGRIKIIFIYEKRPIVVMPKCEPTFDGIPGSTVLYMKRSLFDSLEQISIEYASFGIENISVGKDNGTVLDGEHSFETFDFYIDTGNTHNEAKWDNTGNTTTHSFNVAKSKFTKVNDTQYKANLSVTYVAFCSCNGAGFCTWAGHDVTINIIENKPPVAYYEAITLVDVIDGTRVVNEVYIDREATIINKAYDPNGWDDIDFIYDTFFNIRTKETYNLKMTRDRSNGIMYLDEHNLSEDDIVFNRVTQVGDLKLTFKTDDEWQVTRLVVDLEGLADTYTNSIKPVELNLQPIAKITDVNSYRFPYGIVFSGKQNRVIGLSSSMSRVAAFLEGTTTLIDHSKDCIEIVPLEGQDSNNIHFDNTFDIVIENNTLKINNVNFVSQKLMFKETGKYKIRLQVTDTDGNVSEWDEQIITIVQDTAPNISYDVINKYYRSSSDKTATIQFYLQVTSSDEDYANISEIKYKFDSNNDGNFTDESYKTAEITYKDVIVDGITYKQVTLKANNLGKYEIYISAKDSYGQETISRYITTTDYKANNLNRVIEVDNYAPVGSLSLSNATKKNVDIKILAGDLSGTRQTDLVNGIANFKQSLEADGKINANIEIIRTAKSINSNTALTWRKVEMTGGKLPDAFYAIGENKWSQGGWYGNAIPVGDLFYKEIPDTHTSNTDRIIGTSLEYLPRGIKPTGWNGINIPSTYISVDYDQNYVPLTYDMLNRYINYVVYPKVGADYTHAEFLAIRNYRNLIKAGNKITVGSTELALTSQYQWLDMLSTNSPPVAMSNEKLQDFDISFDITAAARDSSYNVNYGGGDSETYWAGNDYMRYIYFNVKDDRNYYLYYIYYPEGHSFYNGMRYRLKSYGLADSFEDDTKVEGIIKMTNGIPKIIKLFNGKTELNNPSLEYNTNHDFSVSRIKQVGNTLEVYAVKTQYYYPAYWEGSEVVTDRIPTRTRSTVEKKITTLVLDDDNLGGYFGFGAHKEYTYIDNVTLDIKSLTFIENANLNDTVNSITDWRTNSDKYVINIQENAKLDELKNDVNLNKFIGTSQAKDIDLINVGINAVNGTKFKQMITKNLNKGIYIELGSIPTNINSISTYIKGKYPNVTEEAMYILAGDTVNYAEIYSDTENDNKFTSQYMFSHISNHFENSNGTILNNNEWRNEKITTFDKVGKYTLQYKVQDNPLNDILLNNPFSVYRKYSNVFKKEIYVHRKPIAKFSIDNSFKNNVFINYSEIEDFSDNVLKFGLYGERQTYDNGTWNTYGYAIQPYNGTLNISGWVDTEYDYKSSTYVYFNIATANEINPVLSFTYNNNFKYPGADTVNVRILDNSTSTYIYTTSLNNGAGTFSYPLPNNKNLTICISTYPIYYDGDVTCSLDNIKLEYKTINNAVVVPITESSFDLDHQSLTNKGIVEWEWKLVKKDGTVLKQNFSNKVTGINWIKSQLTGTWYDATVTLRVKDMEGAWSDTTSIFIDEDKATVPGEPVPVKPVALFEITRNPVVLDVNTQGITDYSYDSQGLTLMYQWNIYKNNIKVGNYIGNNVVTKLNDIIKTNGVGKYKVELYVINSLNLQSDITFKEFDVVIKSNTAPTVDFNLVSNEIPIWVLPKRLGLITYLYRPFNGLFIEEKSKFNVIVSDPDYDNLGFIYNWKLERFGVNNISNISGAADNIYNYTTVAPFESSFNNVGLPWGAYRITLSVTDKPPIPPYQIGDEKSVVVTKSYYIVPEITLTGSFEGNTEVVVGDTIKIKAKTNKQVTDVEAKFGSDLIKLVKISEDSQYLYWEKNYSIPESITESGTYFIDYNAYTNYGGNGNNTRKVEDKVPIDITALKLYNFRIIDIVNHFDVSFPYTKAQLINKLIDYKTGYFVTFLMDSKGKPDSVNSKILLNGILDQQIVLEKISTGDTETWQGKFYTNARMDVDKIISIFTNCRKGTLTYDFNEKENWNGKSLIIKGSALQDGRINLTN